MYLFINEGVTGICDERGANVFDKKLSDLPQMYRKEDSAAVYFCAEHGIHVIAELIPLDF